MMNGHHRPAGQGMPPDMGRRRPYNQHQHHHQHQHQHQHQQYPPQMYNNYMQPYGATYYPQPLPPQYHNAPIPQPYAPYPPYGRSPPPPPLQQYVQTPIPQQQHAYPPRPQQSPALSAAYQPPPPPPQAPSSTQSSHTIPAPLTPPTPQTAVSAVPSSPEIEPSRMPFRAPLPWLSRPEFGWPARKARRKRKPATPLSTEAVELPDISQTTNVELEATAEPTTSDTTIPRPETPTTSQPASEEADSTNPTTPSSVHQKSDPAAGDATPTPKVPQISPVPAVPIITAVPKPAPRESPKSSSENRVEQAAPIAILSEEVRDSNTPNTTETAPEEAKEAPPAPRAWTTPKLWTGLFNPATATSTTGSTDSERTTAAPSFGKTNAESLAEALRLFSPTSTDSKVAFLEPRGLVNTGNMCYMNSVLQVLVSCFPFYSFLDQVSKRAAYSFKSETPLLDAMILFMREYKVIDSAASVEQLRLRLKDGELEQYGEPFTPDFVYNVINRLPRFSSMRRGHQQDAEEFLGFLLEGLHDECVQVMQSSASNTESAIPTPTNGPSSPTSQTSSVHGSVSSKENGWLEVGPKQKAAVTRSSGTITTGSPVTKIFGGNLRSELRVPGMKDSVTLEPYQPLQLDIGAPNVNNIIDALKGLTRSETLHGDFKSPKGPNVTATKQVFIETLPTVLILHLKRFQYDNAGGTQKIWKKVGYPLELEIPKEVFPRQKRSVYAHSGLPKYRLIAAVYHHGKNASGGHYTVDVRRQDGREWIRLDDTVIRRVRSEEVAEGGSEEDPKILAAVLEAQKKDGAISANGFSAIEGAEDEGDGEGWKQASGSGKKWSSVVNGTSTPKPKSEKFSIKDNKVAYLLFYQRI